MQLPVPVWSSTTGAKKAVRDRAQEDGEEYDIVNKEMGCNTGNEGGAAVLQLYYYLEQGQSSTLKKLAEAERATRGGIGELLQGHATADYSGLLPVQGDAAGGGEAPSQDLDIYLDQCDRTDRKPRRCPGKSKCHHRASNAGA